MTEVPAPYHTGDPGDEQPTRLGYTADEVEEVAPGEYALKQPLSRLRRCVHCGGVVVLGRDHTCRAALRPTYEELAAAITRFAAADKEYSAPQDVLMDQAAWLAVVAEIHALAARMPQPVDPFAEQEINGELH